VASSRKLCQSDVFSIHLSFNHVFPDSMSSGSDVFPIEPRIWNILTLWRLQKIAYIHIMQKTEQSWVVDRRDADDRLWAVTYTPSQESLDKSPKKFLTPSHIMGIPDGKSPRSSSICRDSPGFFFMEKWVECQIPLESLIIPLKFPNPLSTPCLNYRRLPFGSP
jgi:hypothetical protein